MVARSTMAAADVADKGPCVRILSTSEFSSSWSMDPFALPLVVIAAVLESLGDVKVSMMASSSRAMLLHDGGGKMRLGQRRRQQLPQILKFLASNEVMLVPPE